jgi:2-keto-4-pentenoate hydratase
MRPYPDQHDDPRVVSGMRALLRGRARRLEAGSRSVGWKIGVHVPSAQRQLGLRAPFVGCVLDDGWLADGECVRLDPAAACAVEAEIALRIDAPVIAGSDPRQAAEAIGACAAAIELVDYREPPSTLEGVIERSAFHAGILIGPPRDPADLDVEAVEARVAQNGEDKRARDREGCPIGAPGVVVRLVADVLAHHGEKLAVGDWIISGSLTQPLRVAAGDEIEVSVAPLGELALSFTS